MKNNKKYFIILLAVLFIGSYFINIPVLVLEDTKSSKIVFMDTIKPDDHFTMHWMHSVELAPWEEVFKVSKDYKIILDYTRFKAFGAGVPKTAGKKTLVKDGWIHFTEINKPMQNLTYGISNFAKHTFMYKDKNLKLYEMVPNDDPIRIYTKKIPLFSFLLEFFVMG